MIDILYQNPRWVIIAILGILSTIWLLSFAMAIIIADYKGLIKKQTWEFKEHLIIWVSSIVFSVSVFATDLSQWIDNWVINLDRAGWVMIVQYLALFVLNSVLVYHLIKRHYEA